MEYLFSVFLSDGGLPNVEGPEKHHPFPSRWAWIDERRMRKIELI